MMKDEDEIMSEARRNTPRVRKAFSEYMNAIMLSSVAFLLVFVAMAAFTKITVYGQLNLLEVGIQTVVMYVCVVSINLILRAYARRKGRETERWINAKREVEHNARELVARDLVKKAGEYCRAWEEHDVNTVRSMILTEVGLKLEAYEKVKMLSVEEIKALDEEQCKELGIEKPFTKEQIKALRKAKRVKRLHYDEKYLSFRESVSTFRHSPSGGIKSKTVLHIKTAQLLATTALASVFSVSVGVDLILNFSYGTVVMCLMKLATLVISAVFGIIGGYKFSTGREVNEMEDRADEQRRFFKWCGENLPAQMPEIEKEAGE